jgi:serine/threonine protein kinase
MMMLKICTACHTEISEPTGSALCPKCTANQQAPSEEHLDETQTNVGFPPPRPEENNRPLRPEELDALLPDYEVLELIGLGGMGAVYKARSIRIGRMLAIKTLPAWIASSEDARQRFQREAQTLAAVNHPNIVTIHNIGEAENLPYIVMEYVDGVDLQQLIQSGTMEPKHALKLIPQICDALHYAHKCGLVHRDIKPGNILIDHENRIKIADFGLAKLLGRHAELPASSPTASRDAMPHGLDLTQAGQVMGTPRYMAPEQRSRPTEVDHRADIYALGVVFYEMLRGHLPEDEKAAPENSAAIDKRLDKVLRRAMSKQPKKRQQDAHQIKQAFQQIVENGKEEKNPAGTFLSGRKGLILWVVFLFLVLGGVYGLVSFFK